MSAPRIGSTNSCRQQSLIGLTGQSGHARSRTGPQNNHLDPTRGRGTGDGQPLCGNRPIDRRSPQRMRLRESTPRHHRKDRNQEKGHTQVPHNPYFPDHPLRVKPEHRHTRSQNRRGNLAKPLKRLIDQAGGPACH